MPLRDGDHTAEGAPPVAKRRKRRLNALGAASLAAELALVGVNAALGQQNFRRPPARRFALPVLWTRRGLTARLSTPRDLSRRP